MTEPSGVTLQAKCGESTKLLKGMGSVVAGAIGEIIASKPLKAVLFDVAGSSDNTDLCCLFLGKMKLDRLSLPAGQEWAQ